MKLLLKSYRDTILENYDQIAIFSKYLNLEYNTITDCIYSKAKISNPLRVDKDPSFTFYIKDDNRVRMWDFARCEFRGDLFDMVGLLISENPNSAIGFSNIYNNIISTVESSVSFKPKLLTNKYQEGNSQKRHKLIDCTIRDYSKVDSNYWGLHFIDKKFLITERVYALQSAYVEEMMYYDYTEPNPGYVYYYGIGKDSKILQKWYFPFEIKSRKHRTNVTYPFENIYDLKGNKILWLIKSSKDRLVIKNLLLNHVKDKRIKAIVPFIDFISLSSEAVRLKPATISAIHSMYEHKLLTIDFDSTGKATKEYYDKFEFVTKFITDTQHKDIADYVKYNNLLTSINFITEYTTEWLLSLEIRNK